MGQRPRKSPLLAAYLQRIGFGGIARPDLVTLRRLQAAHVCTVPFENIDVQLRRPVGLGLEFCFDKVVRQRRGGWCYELNGLLGWALQEIGFDVMRVSAGVMRERLGDVQMGNHLCLLVRLDQPYLVDVGFGGSLLQPLPLVVAEYDHLPYHLGLTRVDSGYWRFAERSNGEPFSFDFCVAAADEARIAEKCAEQQTNPDSGFVRNLVVQRRVGDSHLALRGRMLTIVGRDRERKTTLASVDDLIATLQDKFDLDVPEVSTLWSAICARHYALFQDP